MPYNTIRNTFLQIQLDALEAVFKDDENRAYKMLLRLAQLASEARWLSRYAYSVSLHEMAKTYHALVYEIEKAIDGLGEELKPTRNE